MLSAQLWQRGNQKKAAIPFEILNVEREREEKEHDLCINQELPQPLGYLESKEDQISNIAAPAS